MQLTIAANVGPLAAIRAQLEARVAEAVTRTAEEIRDKAREAVPVDTGSLKASIRVTSESRLAARVSGGEGLPDARAVYTEYGTRRQRAQPWLTPAAESERQPFLERVKAAVEG